MPLKLIDPPFLHSSLVVGNGFVSHASGTLDKAAEGQGIAPGEYEELLAALTAPDSGLQTARRMSHVYALDVAGYRDALVQWLVPVHGPGRRTTVEAGARVHACVIGDYTRISSFAEINEKIVSGRFCVDRHGMAECRGLVEVDNDAQIRVIPTRATPPTRNVLQGPHDTSSGPYPHRSASAHSSSVAPRKLRLCSSPRPANSPRTPPAEFG